MATEAKIGHGTVLEFETAAGAGTYTPLAERVNIGGPSFSRDAPDATHMDSTDGWREFIAGLKDGGEITINAHLLSNNAAQASALALYESGALWNWRLRFPVSPEKTWVLPAIVTGWELDIPVDDKMMLDITLKVSGKPTLV